MGNSIAEKIFFKSDKATVTSTRFIVPSQTYAMSGITSVRFEVKKPNRLIPIALILGSLLLLKSGHELGGLSIMHWGAILLPGSILLYLQRNIYTVTLNSASGESRPLISKNEKFVRNVIDSLNAAIIERG